MLLEVDESRVYHLEAMMRTKKDITESAVASWLKDFSRKLRERDRLNAELTEMVAGLRAATGGTQPDLIADLTVRIRQPVKLDQAIGVVLRMSETPLSPVQIKNALASRGYDLRKYTFALSAIHHALEKLARHGMLSITEQADGSKLYRWTERPQPSPQRPPKRSGSAPAPSQSESND